LKGTAATERQVERELGSSCVGNNPTERSLSRKSAPNGLKLYRDFNYIGVRSFILTGAPEITRSIPTTWVTVYSGNMGNTFGPKGFSMGSSLQISIIDLAEIVRGEFAENAFRKSFLPSEIDSIRRALEPIEPLLDSHSQNFAELLILLPHTNDRNFFGIKYTFGPAQHDALPRCMSCRSRGGARYLGTIF
jgi:hypothetical protein